MAIISTLVVTTGLLWPYSDVVINILDIVLSVDIMILLLIKNTKQIEDDLNDISFKEVSRSNSCTEYELDLSAQSSILLPFYYFPLVILLVAFGIWAVVRLK